MLEKNLRHIQEEIAAAARRAGRFPAEVRLVAVTKTVGPDKIRLRELQREWARPGMELKELSMGMSNDYIVAVEEGATLVRIGTALFGERSG